MSVARYEVRDADGETFLSAPTLYGLLRDTAVVARAEEIPAGGSVVAIREDEIEVDVYRVLVLFGGREYALADPRRWTSLTILSNAYPGAWASPIDGISALAKALAGLRDPEKVSRYEGFRVARRRETERRVRVEEL